VRQARAFLVRLARATSIVVRDKRIPRPLRWAGGLGLLPIPGPADEAILLVVAIPLFVFYRGPMREAWRAAQDEPATARPST
jgi:hypothetical protein